MENLEGRQREMRERNAQKKREKSLTQPEIAASDHSPEVLRLKKRISQLNERVLAQQVENNRLRKQKTVVVELISGPREIVRRFRKRATAQLLQIQQRPKILGSIRRAVALN